MNKKFLLGAVAACMLAPLVASCGTSGGADQSDGPARKGTITMWVGAESVEFYKGIATEFLNARPEFEYDILVSGADTGAVGGQMEADNTACADIITIAHDNIGKLSENKYIVPIAKNSPLIDQIKNDNPASFVEVSQNLFGSEADAEKRFFGVPYISQALFLLYNKKYVSEEQAKTLEGLKEAAKTAGTKALTFTGGDGFNFSMPVLAVKEADKSTSVKIYKEGNRDNCFFQGNDTIAVTRYMQDYFADTNGAGWASENGWTVDMGGAKPKFLGVIGGAWHYDDAKAILKDDLGVALIPNFTLGAKHVEGLTANDLDKNVPVAGDVYRGGTFADCKVLCMNMAAGPAKRVAVEEIMGYFASKDVQKRSFTAAKNVPAFKGADEWVESIKTTLDKGLYDLASSQMKMASYGIAQPFTDALLNNGYYQLKAPEVYTNTINNNGGIFTSVAAIRKQLYKMQYIWENIEACSDKDVPATLPAEIVAA